MNQPQNKSFLSILINNNFLACMKAITGSFLLVTLSFNIAYALNDQNKTNPDSYKENIKLSVLLEKEQFQIGLSCNEAAKAYKLDKKMNHIIESSLLGLDEERTVKPGFFKGGCRDNQLQYVKKIISSDDNTQKRKVVFDTFIKQYGKPSFQREGIDNIRYYLLFKGIYTEFRLYLHQEKNKTITIYQLQDATPKVKKK